MLRTLLNILPLFSSISENNCLLYRPLFFRWHTPIHEARDLSQQQLEDVKKELEAMKRIRSRSKYRAGSGHRGFNTPGSGESMRQESDSDDQRRRESWENGTSVGKYAKIEVRQSQCLA